MLITRKILIRMRQYLVVVVVGGEWWLGWWWCWWQWRWRRRCRQRRWRVDDHTIAHLWTKTFQNWAEVKSVPQLWGVTVSTIIWVPDGIAHKGPTGQDGSRELEAEQSVVVELWYPPEIGYPVGMPGRAQRAIQLTDAHILAKTDPQKFRMEKISPAGIGLQHS